MSDLRGRACVVIGSAPLAAPLTIADDAYIVAVNGGISSVPRCDEWVVNARGSTDATVIGSKRELHKLMLEQGRGRQVHRLTLLSKGHGARAHTERVLGRLGVRYATVAEVPNERRRQIETQAGARDAAMATHALSAGLFAVAACVLRGAETVRLEGCSWQAGYAYLPGVAMAARGHAAGDKAALRLLLARYPGRLTQSLLKEEPMAKATTPTRPAPAAVSAARTSRQQAKAATTPAAERARKTQQATAARAAVRDRPRRPLVRGIGTGVYACIYKMRRRRVGEVFALQRESDFRPSCMEWAGDQATETPRPSLSQVATNRRLKPNAADVEDAPAGRPGDDNPLGV